MAMEDMEAMVDMVDTEDMEVMEDMAMEVMVVVTLESVLLTLNLKLQLKHLLKLRLILGMAMEDMVDTEVMEDMGMEAMEDMVDTEVMEDMGMEAMEDMGMEVMVVVTLESALLTLNQKLWLMQLLMLRLILGMVMEDMVAMEVMVDTEDMEVMEDMGMEVMVVVTLESVLLTLNQKLWRRQLLMLRLILGMVMEDMEVMVAMEDMVGIEVMEDMDMEAMVDVSMANVLLTLNQKLKPKLHLKLILGMVMADMEDMEAMEATEVMADMDMGVMVVDIGVENRNVQTL